MDAMSKPAEMFCRLVGIPTSVMCILAGTFCIAADMITTSACAMCTPAGKFCIATDMITSTEACAMCTPAGKFCIAVDMITTAACAMCTPTGKFCIAVDKITTSACAMCTPAGKFCALAAKHVLLTGRDFHPETQIRMQWVPLLTVVMEPLQQTNQKID